MLRSRKRRRESVSLLSVTASSEDLPCEEKGAQDNVLKSVSVDSFRPASGTSRRFSIENWGRNFMKKRKIRKLSTSEHNPPSSCLPCDTKEDAKLSRFINWCSRNGITISEKVSEYNLVRFIAISTGKPHQSRIYTNGVLKNTCSQ